MEFKNAFFAIILVSMIMVSAGVILSEWATEYGSGITPNLGEYVRIEGMTDTAESIEGSISPQSGEASVDYESRTYKSGYGIILGMYDNLRLVFGEDGMIDSVMKNFGIPIYVWQGISIMISLAIGLTLAAIIFRRAKSTT